MKPSIILNFFKLDEEKTGYIDTGPLNISPISSIDFGDSLIVPAKKAKKLCC